MLLFHVKEAHPLTYFGPGDRLAASPFREARQRSVADSALDLFCGHHFLLLSPTPAPNSVPHSMKPDEAFPTKLFLLSRQETSVIPDCSIGYDPDRDKKSP